MSSPLSGQRWSRLARALVGAVLGGFLGLLELQTDFSLLSLVSAVATGAVFGSIIGVLAVRVARTRTRAVLLCAFAGAVAGVAWAAMRSSHTVTAAIVGALGGGVLAFLEFRDESGSASARSPPGPAGPGVVNCPPSHY